MTSNEWKSKKFINEADHVVEDLVSSLLISFSPRLRVVEGYNVLVDANVETLKQKQVTLLSGGGSGHEPAHAGFIGDGMLSCAVLGGVFASPSVASILAGIRAVCGPPGCLLIVKNYTGDRLNFGIALEKARAEGLNVEMVVVADDIATGNESLRKEEGEEQEEEEEEEVEEAGVSRTKTEHLASKRGIAGTVFVHKVAGACAQRGNTLSEVHKVAGEVAKHIFTLGVATSVCSLPGIAPTKERDRLGGSLIEIGLGIHGEPGKEQIESLPLNDLIEKMIGELLDYKPLNWKRIECEKSKSNVGLPFAVLINNLGATPMMEMCLVQGSTLQNLQTKGLHVIRSYNGAYMTSIDMTGFSITLFRIPNETILSYLDMDTKIIHWPPPTFTTAIENKEEKETTLSPSHYILTKKLTSGYIITEEEEQDKEREQEQEEEENQEIEGKQKDDEIANFGPSVKFILAPFEVKEWCTIIGNICQSIVNHEAELNELDAMTGDGDCGLTMKRGALAILELVKNTFYLDVDDINADQAIQIPPLFLEIAYALGNTMGGTSGALFEIFFTATANKLKQLNDKQHAIQTNWELHELPLAGFLVLGMEEGIHAMEKYGAAKEGYRTMLDALLPALRAMQNYIELCKRNLNKEEEGQVQGQEQEPGEEGIMTTSTTTMTTSQVESFVIMEVELDVTEMLKVASDAANEGALRTKSMEALAGRSNYINSSLYLDKAEDPGAKAVAYIFKAFYEAVRD